MIIVTQSVAAAWRCCPAGRGSRAIPQCL